MAEIITEPERTHVVHHVDNNESGSNAMAMLAGIVLLIVVAVLFFYFALPMLNRATTPTQVNVPDKVDVNVNRTQ